MCVRVCAREEKYMKSLDNERQKPTEKLSNNNDSERMCWLFITMNLLHNPLAFTWADVHYSVDKIHCSAAGST